MVIAVDRLLGSISAELLTNNVGSVASSRIQNCSNTLLVVIADAPIILY